MLSIGRSVHKDNIKLYKVLIEFRPYGRDVWTFDANLILAFSDGTENIKSKKGIRLDSDTSNVVF